MRAAFGAAPAVTAKEVRAVSLVGRRELLRFFLILIVTLGIIVLSPNIGVGACWFFDWLMNF